MIDPRKLRTAIDQSPHGPSSLAKATQFDLSTIFRWLDGTRTGITMPFLTTLAKELCVEPGDLISYEISNPNGLNTPSFADARMSETDRVTAWSACSTEEALKTQRLSTLGLKVLKPSIRSSGLALAQVCPRKYLYRYRLGLEPRGYSPAIAIGKIYHAARDLLLQEPDQQRVVNQIAEAVNEKCDSLLQEANDLGVLPGGQDALQLTTNIQKDFSLALAMALWAHQQSALDPQVWEVLATEKLIEVQYQTLNTPIRVRIDMLLRNRKLNQLWILDHKTCSDDPRSLAKGFQFALQPKLYRLALQTWLEQQGNKAPPGVLTGCIHDLIKKPTIRLKQGEQFPEYVDRVIQRYDENILALQRSVPNTVPMFLRCETRYHGPIMDSEMLLALRQADLMAQGGADHLYLDQFPRAPEPSSTCFKYGTPCPYLDLCTTNPKRWTPEGMTDRFRIRSRDEQDASPQLLD